MIKAVKNIFWEICARIGVWIPCGKYMPNPKYWDWVLISYYEPGLTYRYIPRVAEYSRVKKMWHDNSDDGLEVYLNENCKVTHWHKIPIDKHLKIKG